MKFDGRGAYQARKLDRAGARISATFEGRFSDIRTDFNAALDSLAGAMAQITLSSADLCNGAGEISGASDDLARRTEQQPPA